jgi:hypothetical protein
VGGRFALAHDDAPRRVVQRPADAEQGGEVVLSQPGEERHPVVEAVVARRRPTAT